MLHKDDLIDCVLIQFRISPGWVGAHSVATAFDFAYLGILQFVYIFCFNRWLSETRDPYCAYYLLVALMAWSFLNFGCYRTYSNKALAKDSGMGGLELWLFALWE